MSTKKNPGNYDCYVNAEDDEPMFIVLARDKDAPLLVRLWALLREQAVEQGAKPVADLAQVQEARQCAYEMDRWKRRKDIERDNQQAMELKPSISLNDGGHLRLSASSPDVLDTIGSHPGER